MKKHRREGRTIWAHVQAEQEQLQKAQVGLEVEDSG